MPAAPADGNLLAHSEDARPRLLSAALIAVGAGAAASVFALQPLLGFAAILALALVVGVSLLGVSVVALSLAILVYSPETLSALPLFGRPELPKAVIALALVYAACKRGIDAPRGLPVLLYGFAGLATFAFGHPADGLGLTQMVSSLVTLTLGWFAFCIRWDFRRDRQVLMAITLLPSLSLLAALPLSALGYTTIWFTNAEGGIPRLQGASIAAQLALMAVVAVGTALMWRRVSPGRWPTIALALNTAIAVATVTRGAMIALVILAVPHVLRFCRDVLHGRRSVAALAGGAVAAAGALGAVFYIVSQRSYARFYVPGQGYIGDDSSGRFDEWGSLIQAGLEQPVFGHGIGAGPVLGARTEGFLNQHQEYLRLLMESGFVGGGLVLAAMLIVTVGAARATAPVVRPEVIASLAALFVYAITDNPFSSPPALVPWLIGVAIFTRVPVWPAPAVARR